MTSLKRMLGILTILTLHLSISLRLSAKDKNILYTT